MIDYNETDYNSIVVDNFFKYLKVKCVTQKKYAEDNNIHHSILSKWKNGDSLMSLEYVIQAAKYFDITVNDLVYSDHDKRKLEVLRDKTYSPIVAQQSVIIHEYGRFFKVPGAVIGFMTLIFVLFVLLSEVLKHNSPYYPVVLIGFVPVIFLTIYRTSFEKKTLIINYLDRVFLTRSNLTNKYYKYSLTVRIISTVLVLYYLTVLVDINEKLESIGLVSSLILILFLLLIGSFMSISELHRVYKKEIHDRRIEGLYTTIVFLGMHFALFGLAILVALVNHHGFMVFFSITLLMLVLNAIDYVLVSKSLDEYHWVYQKDSSNPEPLNKK